VDPYLQKEGKWTDTYKETLGSCNRYEERVCAEERKGISIVKRRERRGAQVHFGIIEKRVH